MGVHTFSKGISLKVNLITQLEFEPTYFVAAVVNLSNYTTGTSPLFIFVYFTSSEYILQSSFGFKGS